MKLFFLTLKDIKNVINISLSLIIILSSIRLLNDSKFSSYWPTPNLGDNYFFLTFLILIVFLLLNLSHLKFNIKKIDYLFFFIIFYFCCIEILSNEKNFRYILDFSSVFIFYKFFNTVRLSSFHDYFIKLFVLSIFFSFFLYLLIITLRIYDFYFIFINYNSALYSYTEFFYLVIFSYTLLALKYNNYQIILVSNLIIIVYLLFLFSRSSLLIFLIVFPLIIFQLKNSNKKKFFLIFINIFFIIFMLEKPINTTVKSFEINDNEENILFDDKFSGEKNSTIHRINNFKRHLNKLYKENIFLGRGYQKTLEVDNIRLDENYNIEFGKCECSHFHSLFAYGIVGLILVLILFFLIIYYPVISDIKKRLQKFIF